MEKSVLINQFKKGYELIVDVINQLPPDLIDYKPSPSKWSIREIIAHILDSEINYFIRFRTAIAENGNSIAPYDEEKWASNLYYEMHNLDDDIELFKLLRKNTTKLFLSIPESSWNNYFIHPERGKIILSDYIQLVIEHLNIHLKQILRNYHQWEDAEKPGL